MIERLRVDLPFTRGAPRAARAAVRRCLLGSMSGASADDVDLIVTELVANAVMHGRPPVGVVVLQEDCSLRIEVTDGATAGPDVPASGRGRVGGGRGTMIVERLASRWGVLRRAHGKCVWASYTSTNALPIAS